MLNLINSNLEFREGLSYSNNAKMIILHDADSVILSIDHIHKWHLGRGWSGCVYHYFVRKYGRIYIGGSKKL